MRRADTVRDGWSISDRPRQRRGTSPVGAGSRGACTTLASWTERDSPTPILARPDPAFSTASPSVTVGGRRRRLPHRDQPADTPELRREQLARELTDLRDFGYSIADLVERGKALAARKRPAGGRGW